MATPTVTTLSGRTGYDPDFIGPRVELPTGRADDETEDNAASPFDTAEIPVPHSREYERAEDAPAIRALLAKKRAGDRKSWLEQKGDLATLEV